MNVKIMKVTTQRLTENLSRNNSKQHKKCCELHTENDREQLLILYFKFWAKVELIHSKSNLSARRNIFAFSHISIVIYIYIYIYIYIC
jgi:hypothetical protein